MAGKHNLPMPEWEIVEFYCRAADRKAQIEILADLNVTTPAVIREILVKRGFDLPVDSLIDTENPTKEQIMDLISRVEVRSVFDCEEVVDAYLANKTDREMAKIVGKSERGVSSWRYKRGLPCRAEYRTEKRKRKPKMRPVGIAEDVEGQPKGQVKPKKEANIDIGREELVKLIHGCAEMIADYLIAQGVAVKEAK